MVRYKEFKKQASNTAYGPFSIIALILLIFELIILLLTTLGVFTTDNFYIKLICDFPWIIVSFVLAIIGVKTRGDSLSRALVKINFFIILAAIVLIIVMTALFGKTYNGTFEFLRNEISPALWGRY